MSTGSPHSQQWDSSRSTRARILSRRVPFERRGFEVAISLTSTLYPQSMKKNLRALSIVSALAMSAPLLSACGSTDAAHDACMAASAERAAKIDGGAASDYAGDYDLMGLCDDLVGAYPDDEGRVVHAVGCVADYVEANLDNVFQAARADGATAADLMDDPMSISVCL